MSKNQNNTGKQQNNSDTSFSAAKVKNDKKVPFGAKADTFNVPSQRPTSS